MKGTAREYLIVLLVSIAAYSVLGLHCYHCASDKLGSDCETDVEELKQGVFSKFAINCTDYYEMYDPVCVIETRKQKGVILKIIRSCSDGVNFSFDNKLSHLKNFKYLNAKSNVTICGIHQGLICVSLCDTNMCNGPSGAIVDFNITSGSGNVAFKTMPLIIGTGITFANMKP